MTYGWAILIIAIVIAAIFQLNLFNPYTFAPRASPGSCQILRPNGPGSNLFVSAVGPGCTINEIPQYVAQFSGTGSQLITISSSQSLTNLPHGETWTVWFSVSPTASGSMGLANKNGYPPYTDYYFPSTTQLRYEAGSIPCSFATSGSAITPAAWYFAALTYSPTTNTLTGYLNNNQEGSCGGGVFTQDSGPLQIGAYAGSFDGQVANFQIYNTSLSQPGITALYHEGIGGAPTNLQNLVGWWPLNGNAKDYSGNNNNGVPTNVIYTSSWTSGYSTP